MASLTGEQKRNKHFEYIIIAQSEQFSLKRPPMLRQGIEACCQTRTYINNSAANATSPLGHHAIYIPKTTLYASSNSLSTYGRCYECSCCIILSLLIVYSQPIGILSAVIWICSHKRLQNQSLDGCSLLLYATI